MNEIKCPKCGSTVTTCESVEKSGRRVSWIFCTSDKKKGKPCTWEDCVEVEKEK